jgi:HAD superfamily hydrolase (TIGR01509 family)
MIDETGNLLGIRHLIFDLGGVILNLDYSLTQKAFTEAGIENVSELFGQLSQVPFFDDWEMGKITRGEFIAGLQKIAPLTEQQVLECWNAMLLDFPLARLQLLQQLRQRYDMILLSNANEIHEEALNKILLQTCGYPSIGVFFDRVYFSHRLGMRKPDKKIFQKILDENGFEAAHTLFIDDSPQHIEAAKELGIPAIWLQAPKTIEDIFKVTK